MTIEEAAALIADSGIDGTVWADLGCGDGTFTRALATRLPAGAVIHAIDHDRAALSRIPSSFADVTISTHDGDFTALPWPFADLDGALMANSLHFVRHKLAFLRAIAPALRRRRLLIVEYDTRIANPWVPYPIEAKALQQLLADAGYPMFKTLGSRPSVYRRATIYAALGSGI